MRQLRHDEVFHRGLDRVDRSGHGEDEGVAAPIATCIAGDESGDGAAEHRRRADLCVTEHAEEFAEAVQRMREAARDDLDGRVAPRDARAAGREDDLNARVADPFVEAARDLRWFIAADGVGDDGVPALREHAADERPALVGRLGASVGDGEDGAGDGLSVRGGAVLLRRSGGHGA